MPSTPLASSARRCSTPKRCCSSTTQTPRRAKRTAGSIRAWVPTISPSSPLASWSRARLRVGAGVAPVSSAKGIASAPSSRSERRRVLLGQRSRSAPSAPPGSPLPAPATSRRRRPPSSPTRPPPSAAAASARRSRGRRRSRRRRRSWSAVGSNGSDSIQRATSSPGLPNRGAGLAARCARLRRREQRLVEEQLLEGEPLAGLLERPRSPREMDRA